MLSIAIIFPLVFTIRGSFKRREKALEHLSKFLSSLKTVKYYILSNEEVDDERKAEVERMLIEINSRTLEHLSKKKR